MDQTGEPFFSGSILKGSIFLGENFDGEHFDREHFVSGRILRGAFGGELLFGEHLTPNENYDMNGLKL